MLNIGKGRHFAIPQYQQFAIQHGVEIQTRDNFGEGRGNILGPAAPESGATWSRRDLDANAIPFPFRAIGSGIERAEICFFQGMRQHQRPEDGCRARVWLRRAALKPGKKRFIGCGDGVPGFLNRLHRCAGPFGECHARQPC